MQLLEDERRHHRRPRVDVARSERRRAVLREPALLLAALRLRPAERRPRRCRRSTRASSRPRSTSRRPAWFDILYADRVTAPVPIVGSVAAKRAQSYDYLVEWAPGVEPADTRRSSPIVDWVLQRPRDDDDRRPSASPLGDVRPQRDQHGAHARSGLGEVPRERPHDHAARARDRALRRRRRARARRAGRSPSSTSMNGLDPDLAQGFPIAIGASMESSPKLADIDGDGVRDIVVARLRRHGARLLDRHRHARRDPGLPLPHQSARRPEPQPGRKPRRPRATSSAPAYANGASGGIDPSVAREAIVATPAIGDVDGDGKPEIVVSTWQGTIYVVDADGKELPGWPKRLPLVPSCPLDLPSPTATTMPCMDTGHFWSRGAGGEPGARRLRRGRQARDRAGGVRRQHLHLARRRHAAGGLAGPSAQPARQRVQPHPVDAGRRRLQRRRHTRRRVRLERRGRARAAARATRFSSTAAASNAPSAARTSRTGRSSLTSLYVFPVVAEGIDSAPAVADFEQTASPRPSSPGNGARSVCLPRGPGRADRFRRSGQPRSLLRRERGRRDADPVWLPGRAGRARSDEHLRGRLPGEPPGHDVPALQPAVGRRPRSGRRTRRHHVGR